MDQDFLNDIEPSSMSVDDILREFDALEGGAETPPQRPLESRPAHRPQRAGPERRPPVREPKAPSEEEAPKLRRAFSGPGAAFRLPWRQPAAASLPEEESVQGAPITDRGQSAETEKPMDFEEEKEQRAPAETDEDQELIDLIGTLFRLDREEAAVEAPVAVDEESAPAQPADEDGAPAQPDKEPEPAPEEALYGDVSLEDILREFGVDLPERPAEEPASSEPAEPQFFRPKKPERSEADRASAAEYAAYAAGGAVSPGEKSGSVSSMADEALRYMSSLSPEDFERLNAEPAGRPVSSRKDVGAEYFNLSGRQDKITFAGRELDLSADEDYAPPAQTGEPIYHWTAGEEGLSEAPEEKPNLLQRIISFGSSLRRDSKRPLRSSGKDAAEDEAAESGQAEPSENDGREDGLNAVSDDTQIYEPQEQAPDVDAVSGDTQIYEPQEQTSDRDAVPGDTQIYEPRKQASGENAARRPAPGDDIFNLSFDDNDSPTVVYAPAKDYSPEEYTEAEEEEKEDGAFGEEPAAAEGEQAGPDRDVGEAPKKRRRRKAPPRVEEEIALDENGEFPSFTQYVSNLITGMLLGLRGAPAEQGSFAPGPGEDELGPEVTPAEASRHYGSFVPSLRQRFRIGLVLLAVLAWISLGLPVSGMLRTVRVASAMCLALQLTIMLLSLDVITNAAVNLAQLRFGADSLASFCCVLTSFDALAVALDAFGSPHMPLCLLSSLSLMGTLYASCVSARGLRKALRVPSIAKQTGSVSGEAAAKGKGLTLLKTDRPITGFVRRTEEAPLDETVFLRVSPALLLLCLLLAGIVAVAGHAGGDFLYIFTALLTPAAPIAALLCFALPFFIGSNRIFSSGAAVAGWSGLRDVGRSQNLIITDRDLFPEGSVEIDKVRIFADADPERILSYVGTMILASGSGLAPCFAELMNRNGGTIRHADGFELLPGGGMKAIIDGSSVLCGGTELMRLMNVRVPFRLVDNTTVLLAVDGILYGIFNMKYIGQPQVRRALQGLIRSTRHPVFAIRDFNVNPEMLHEVFDIATDGYDFPPYLERFKLSEVPEGSTAPVAAVICREGLGSLSQLADTGRGMYLATRFNLIVTLIAAVVGVFMVFIRFLNVGSVGIGFLLLFALLWALPVFAASLALKF